VRVPAASGRAQRARILEALARLQPLALAGAPAFPPAHRGELRWLVQ